MTQRNTSKPCSCLTDGLYARRPLRILVAGQVDHGEPTLMGRLLHETRSVPAEPDRNASAGIRQVRDFVPILAPGPAGFYDLIAGVPADAAILEVDAVEGVREQTRHRCDLLQGLGIQQLIVVISKMDRVAYDAGRFRIVETEITEYLASLDLDPIAIIPVSVCDGVGITEHTYTFEWFRPTLVDVLDQLKPQDLTDGNFFSPDTQGDASRATACRMTAGRLQVTTRAAVVLDSLATSRTHAFDPATSPQGRL